ncbi:MAG: DUF3800 domain-containing protein [Bacilli bacterium]|nr:DUF3800 domain-containing protein [Bacilli bacterium]
MSDINVYCDESCHLPNDSSKVMVLGAVFCLERYRDDIFNSIHKIKDEFHFSKKEMKWSKISSRTSSMYKRIIDYFFETASISFRGVVIRNKNDLKFIDHSPSTSADVGFSSDGRPFVLSTWNEWYYKMYYILLANIVSHISGTYSIFLDRKDTNGKEKIEKLKTIMGRALHDDDRIERITEVDSNRNDLIQLADFFCGLLTYHHRGLDRKPNASKAKKELVAYLEKKTNINRSVSLSNMKFNLFFWTGNRD